MGGLSGLFSPRTADAKAAHSLSHWLPRGGVRFTHDPGGDSSHHAYGQSACELGGLLLLREGRGERQRHRLEVVVGLGGQVHGAGRPVEVGGVGHLRGEPVRADDTDGVSSGLVND